MAGSRSPVAVAPAEGRVPSAVGEDHDAELTRPIEYLLFDLEWHLARVEFSDRRIAEKRRAEPSAPGLFDLCEIT